MELIPYLYFDGNCEEAFRYYEKHLGGRIEALVTLDDTPVEADYAAEWKDRIMHARLVVGDTVLMASDDPSGRYETPRGMRVSINLSDVGETERIFAALAEGGEVDAALEETFFADRFGMVTDRFGTPWLIHCEEEEEK